MAEEHEKLSKDVEQEERLWSCAVPLKKKNDEAARSRNCLQGKKYIQTVATKKLKT